jgi:hypothetical protein
MREEKRIRKAKKNHKEEKAALLRRFEANRAKGETVQLEINRLREGLGAKEMAMKQVRRDRERLKNEQTDLAVRRKNLTEQANDSPNLARITRRSWARTQYESLISELEDQIDQLNRKVNRQKQLMRERILRERKMPSGEGAQGPSRATNGAGGQGTNGVPPDARGHAAWAHIGETYAEDLIQAENRLPHHEYQTQSPEISRLAQEVAQLNEIISEEYEYEDAYENYTEHIVLRGPCRDPSDEGKDNPGDLKDDSAM